MLIFATASGWSSRAAIKHGATWRATPAVVPFDEFVYIGIMSSNDTILDLKRQQLKLTKRLLAYDSARSDLLSYLQIQMPDPADIEDPELTRYVATPQARMLCRIMQYVDWFKF